MPIHSSDYIELITRLRLARKNKSLTQAELGALLHKPQSYVSKVETCERRLDVIETAEWCLALGIRLEDLFSSGLREKLDKNF